MKQQFSLFIGMLILSFTVMAQEQSDVRQKIEMPADIQEKFLANMRGHFMTLDNILAAMAEGDLSKAADVAEIGLGMGQGKTKRQCEDDPKGMSPMHKHGQGQKHGMMMGYGQFMPVEMKAMGKQMHQASNQFTVVAREGDPQKTLSALQQVTSACVGCHQVFKVR